MQLEDLKIIVTGGAQGMGAHFARRLHEAGAKVAVGDVKEEALAALPEGIKRRKLDVSNEADVIAFVDWANTELGGLNGLINNAGILRDGLLVKKDKATGAVVKMSAEQFNAVINVNLTGATLMVREVVAKMVSTGQRPGVIVNMSSIARHGNRGQSNYVSAKAALAANTVTWSREFAPFGIRVGAVAPGMILTPMNGRAQTDPEYLAYAEALIPSRRAGLPADIAHMCVFLASEQASYCTGMTHFVDGGWMLTQPPV